MGMGTGIMGNDISGMGGNGNAIVPENSRLRCRRKILKTRMGGSGKAAVNLLWCQLHLILTIGGGRGQWLGGGTMASAEHEPITGVWVQSPQRGQEVSGAKPPEAESIFVIGCPTEPANLARLVKFIK